MTWTGLTKLCNNKVWRLVAAFVRSSDNLDPHPDLTNTEHSRQDFILSRKNKYL